MSVGRILSLMWSEVRLAWKRPLFIVFLSILALMSLGFVMGGVQIRTGSVETGGAKAWINSEFNLAFVDIVLLALILPFFASVACGMCVAQDEERQFGRLLHATPMSFLEYAIARFAGAIVPIAIALGIWMLVQVGLYQLWPIDDATEVRGPFAIGNYLWPLVLFGGPMLLFAGGVAMLLGTWTRQAALVFAFPTVLLIGGVFFVWSWSPEWLAEPVNWALQLIDPAGMRWLTEQYLNEDRGAAYYNTTPIVLGPAFALSRAAFALVGLACVPVVAAIVARRVRGTSPDVALASIPPALPAIDIAEVAARGPLPAATQSAPGFLRTTWATLRTELRCLIRSPGIWIFGPLILIQVVGTSMLRVGPLDTVVLSTSGSIAAGAFNTLTLLLTLLILYYTVESLIREERHGLGLIYRSTAASTAGMLAGKVLANALLAAVIVGAAFLAALVVLAIQAATSKVLIAPEPSVFALIWIVLLGPTLILWSAFVAFLYALIRNRYATYAMALVALIATGFAGWFEWLNWASRWHLWSSVRWSDLDRLNFAWKEIVWNRVLMLAIAAFFVSLALSIWPRRVPDARAVMDRLRPARVLRWLVLPVVAAIPAIVIAGGMGAAMRAGSEGGPAVRKAKDYWKQNSATWENAPTPALDSVVADIDLHPESRAFAVRGEYVLRNASDEPVEALPLTVRRHLTASNWTVDGIAVEPTKSGDRADPPSIEDRSGLLLVRPAKPLAPGATVRVGFGLEGDGSAWSKRRAGAGEFLLPAGVVLTSFSGSFLPAVGFSEGIGVDRDNSRDSKEYPDDHWKTRVDPLFGPAWASDVMLTVTAPADWIVNAVGTPGDERVEGDRKTVTWRSDHPVRFFNLVGGPLERSEGESTTVYYASQHPYNVGLMTQTLDAARDRYSEWFYPYPWRDLKLTEFPGLADYAQGFPGNISFSESIGFLTRKAGEDEADAVTFVVAHESTHQWWGNILTPGKGPGGNVLSEGMANFSAELLIEDFRGDKERQALMRKFEDQYVNGRRADSERALHKVDGTRDGDSTVMYDRGGWVFWMLKDLIGRENMLAGLREFIEQFKDGPDFPLVEDLIVTLRPHAKDKDAFDAFVKEWVFGKALPEFVLSDVRAESAPDGATRVTGTVTNVGTGHAVLELAAVGHASEGAEPPRALTSVAVAPDAPIRFSVDCDFVPERVVVDPDVRILQAGRKRAAKHVEAQPAGL